MKRESPFLDLAIKDDEEGREIRDAIERVLVSGRFIGGEEVLRFEEEFAYFTGAAFATSVSSGTDALVLALKGAGLSQGDRVIVPSFTFFATAEAVVLARGVPLFCDVDERTLSLSPAAVEEALAAMDRDDPGGAVRFALPVHLFGRVAAMPELMRLFRKRGIRVIEDACQAHGARLRGRHAGSTGIAGAFSFYPTKNLGGIGEGGAIVTSNRELDRRIKALRDHGQVEKNRHTSIGFNARLDAIKCAVLRVRLRYLKKRNRQRMERARFYLENLGSIRGVTLPSPGVEDENHVFHLFVIRVRDRERVLREMEREGIRLMIHYPYALHTLRAFRGISMTPSRPEVSESAAGSVISIPLSCPDDLFFRIKGVLERVLG